MEGVSLEVLELIQETAVKAAGSANKVTILDAPQLGVGKVLIVRANGDYDFAQKTESRTHRLGNLDSVCDWVKYAGETLGVNSAIWLSETGLRVVIDDMQMETPRALVTYDFVKTREYSLIQTLATGEPRMFDQKQFVRLLRNDLYDCLDITKRDQWIKIFRSLEAREASNARSDIQGSRQSLGRDLEDEVTSQLGQIPDQMRLSVRLFQDSALETRQPVLAEIECQPLQFRFALIPRQCELDQALENELADMCKYLASKLGTDTPIFRGVYSGK